jgi:hypothetical protein
MDPNFLLITDLPAADQAEIARIEAIDESARTDEESAYLEARTDYTRNSVRSIQIKIGEHLPNATYAAEDFTLSGDVSDGETVSIGSQAYEFDTDSSVMEGNILVDVSGDQSPGSAISADSISR